jgi:ribosome-binding factor A
MSGGQRIDRVAEEFREVLAEEVQRLKDPRVGFVTLTHVEVTPDLRRAIVYYTVLGEDRDHKSTRAGLRSAAPRLRTALGHAVRLKFTPMLEFREDVGQAHLDRVAELLRRLDHKAPPADGAIAQPMRGEDDA